MAVTMVEGTRPVTGGVDTHLDTHVGAALDGSGGVLGVESFPATRVGYASLSSWLAGFGLVERVGVEGTGAYGAGLARHLRSLGVEVIEVDRPHRQLRRAPGKSDSLDAIEAARAVLSGRATGVAKTADGNVEAMRALLIAKRSGREARITCLNQIRHLGFTAPDELRERFGSAPRTALAARPPPCVPDPTATRWFTPRSSRCAASGDACSALTTRSPGSMPPSPSSSPPRLRLCSACSASLSTPPPSSASPPATIPSECAAKPHGRSEAAWAQLCGVAPLEATSGKVTRRHRLNRDGNRQANHTLWRIVFTRLGADARTRSYVTRRPDDGLSRPEIIRSLKRYIARETYRHLPR